MPYNRRNHFKPTLTPGLWSLLPLPEDFAGARITLTRESPPSEPEAALANFCTVRRSACRVTHSTLHRWRAGCTDLCKFSCRCRCRRRRRCSMLLPPPRAVQPKLRLIHYHTLSIVRTVSYRGRTPEGTPSELDDEFYTRLVIRKVLSTRIWGVPPACLGSR